VSRLDSIPSELRARDQWVCWRRVQRAGKSKPTKEPWRADGSGRASSTDPATWTTFENASAALERGRFDGLGYVFAADDPYAGVDLDGCIDEHGEMHPAAAAIVQRLDSYAERTPSGAGVHVIVKATLRSDRHSTARTRWGDKFEVYDRGRFFTVTGNGSGEIGERQVQLDVLVADMFSPPMPPRSSLRASAHVTADDRELLRRAFAARNGTKVRALYDGDTSSHGGDDSAADLALCSALAFWTGPYPDRIDQLFRGSGLYREKWDSRRGDSTYGRQTIEKALQACTNYYECSTARRDTRNAHRSVREDGRDDAGHHDRNVVITRASDLRSKRLRCAWKGYVPLGYLTIQTGESKLGKSTFFAHIAAQITHGRLPGEFCGQPAPVLILAAEDNRDDQWKPRLDAAGADLDLVAFLNIPDGWNVRDGVPLIARGLDELPAPVVFVDAVMEHLPETRGSETANSVTFVRRSLRPFANLCEQRRVAGVISTHPPKSRANGFADAYHGSGAFVQMSRSCLLFGWHPEDRELSDDKHRRVLLRAAGNIGRDPGALSFRVAGTPVTLDDGEQDEIGYAQNVELCHLTARDLLNTERPSTGGERDRPRAKVDVLVERIRDYLVDGRWHPSISPELEAEGFAWGTIQEARNRVARARKAPGTMSGAWEWRLDSSETADSSTDHKRSARALLVSPQSDSSTDRGEDPTTTEPVEESDESDEAQRRRGIGLPKSRRVRPEARLRACAIQRAHHRRPHRRGAAGRISRFRVARWHRAEADERLRQRCHERQ
jgi:NrS-1  polymerase HBD domain/AAA domain